MDLDEKLMLQKKLKGLVLIKEKSLFYAYNESCYILTHVLGLNLKIQANRTKQHSNWVIMCSVSKKILNDCLPTIAMTKFGAQLAYKINLQQYNSWYKEHCRHAISICLTEIFSKEKALTDQNDLQQKYKKSRFLDLPSIKLTQEQYNYLAHWVKGKYPIEMDLNFIEVIKNNVIYYQSDDFL